MHQNETGGGQISLIYWKTDYAEPDGNILTSKCSCSIIGKFCEFIDGKIQWMTQKLKWQVNKYTSTVLSVFHNPIPLYGKYLFRHNNENFDTNGDNNVHVYTIPSYNIYLQISHT